MINIMISSIIIAYICNKLLYKICDRIKKTKFNTIIIYLANVFAAILIYYKYGITVESIKYLSLIPFIIIISIIDYYTTYIYDMTILSGIIIQGIIFLIEVNYDINSQSHIVALIVGFIIPYILCITTKSLGQGDVGLYCLCCFVIGHNYSIYLIILSFILACPYAIYILFNKKDKTRKIPFASFISLATTIIMVTQKYILNIYFEILTK